MPIDDWMPTVKTMMLEVHAAAKAADYIQTKGKVCGYNEWPGKVAYLPTSLISVKDGDQTYGSSSPALAHHNLKIWVFFQGVTLAQSQKMAVPFIELVRNKFATNITLGGNVDHCLPPNPPEIFYSGPGMLRYGNEEYPGLIFNYDIKEDETGTFTVSATP